MGAAQHGAWAESEGGYEGSALGVLEAAFLEALRATEGVVEATAQLYSTALTQGLLGAQRHVVTRASMEA